MTALRSPVALSVTRAAERGASALFRAAEEGQDIVVERHGKAVAAVVSMQRLSEIGDLEADLRSASIVITRLATDDGRRTDLDEVITTFGFNRTELEAELDADLAAGRT